MLKRNFFRFVSVTTVLFFAMTGVSFASGFKFPPKIEYKIFVKGVQKGSSQFTSRVARSRAPMYQLSFGKFEALGFTSRDKIHTVIFKEDLSFSQTMLMRGKEKIYEMKAKKGSGMFEDEADLFVYKENTLAGEIVTEPYTPHKVIDLLSLFLVASESVANNKKGPQKFSFFVKKTTEVVELTHVGQANVSYQGQQVPTTVVELSHQGKEVLKLNIYHDNSNGFYFPVRLSIKDKVQGLIEFQAATAF